MSFDLSILTKRILIFDGSMGALLQSRSLPIGYAPDLWNLEKSDEIIRVHQEYAQAGADIVMTNSFGATRLRLAEYGAGSKVKMITEASVDLARRGAPNSYVAGNVGPLGAILEPVGDLSFDAAVEIFHEQIKVLVESGVDLIVIETMFDLLEMKAAVIAANEVRKNIPIIASMTFNDDKITDTGVTPAVAAVTLEGLGVEIIGANCSTGPEAMLKVVKELSENVSTAFISAKPNAGLPVNRGDITFYKMGMEELASFAPKFVKRGVNILGGCCGSTPIYISMIKKSLSNVKPIVKGRKPCFSFTSQQNLLYAGSNERFIKIGEKINPTGRKLFSEAIKGGRTDLIVQEARKEELHNADALDINVGVPLVDEALIMKKAIATLLNITMLPLVIDSSDSAVIESALKIYPGKALINSLSGESIKIEQLAPIAKRYGASLVGLLAADEIPESSKDRVKVAEYILKRVSDYGIGSDKIIFDVLALAVSAMQYGAKETLETISIIKKEFDMPTIVGLSNVSFGLPNRKQINKTFLSMAIARGLDAAILDPYDSELHDTIQAGSMFVDRDEGCKSYITSATLKDKQLVASQDKPQVNLTPMSRVYNAIIEGDKDSIEDLITKAINDGVDPLKLFTSTMTGAIREVGQLFAKRLKFIPHLVASAETMKIGADLLENKLSFQREKEPSKGVIIFATVKGDVHDIGKNICVLMLGNFGFNVIDLGRNVDSNSIIEAAKKHNANIIALSALMTTTMKEMKVVIDRVREENLPFKVIVGGAVVTKGFAQEIGADRYVKDVGGIVCVTEELVSLE
ncbi:MAG: homocysteine S-methyltransferase family protein [Nitrospinota bacterium]